MGNGPISTQDYDLLRWEYEKKKKENLSIPELANHITNYIENNISINISTNVSAACTLKIVGINDVYEIESLPNFATCRAIEGFNNGDLVICVLPGDFVAPSLLSSLDKGFGMIDCLNLAGVDFVCIGNHENDITLPQLHDRIVQSNFQWINSNMSTMPLRPEMEPLPEYVILEVKGRTHTRRVALLGLNTNDKAIYRQGAFGGCTIEPIMSKAKELHAKIMATETVDAIIPLTHQLMAQDRDLAATGLFPVIMGGHDHEPYLETISGCTIVKSGMDAKLASICSVTWADETASKPTVTVEVKETSRYPPMPKVVEAVASHKKLIDELERSTLCKIPETVHLSSVGMRLRPTTMGTFICSILRRALGSDCALLTAGCIRARKSYENEKSFSYAHLKAEMPFPTEIAVVVLPGHVICDMISYTREFALRAPPVEKGGYLQSDDGIEWERTGNFVTKISGKLVDAQRMYSVAINLTVLNGMDDIQPLLAYKASCAPDDHNLNKSDESSMNAKEIIVAHFSKLLLYQIVSTERFEDIDLDGDGQISKEELMAIARKKFGDGVSSLMINNLFNVADLDGSGFISSSELIQIYISAMSMLEGSPSAAADEKDALEWISVEDVVNIIYENMHGMFTKENLLDEIKLIDKDNSGYITLREYSQFKQSKARRSVSEVSI